MLERTLHEGRAYPFGRQKSGHHMPPYSVPETALQGFPPKYALKKDTHTHIHSEGENVENIFSRSNWPKKDILADVVARTIPNANDSISVSIII